MKKMVVRNARHFQLSLPSSPDNNGATSLCQGQATWPGAGSGPVSQNLPQHFADHDRSIRNLGPNCLLVFGNCTSGPSTDLNLHV
jgi:hypothetical protein